MRRSLQQFYASGEIPDSILTFGGEVLSSYGPIEWIRLTVKLVGVTYLWNRRTTLEVLVPVPTQEFFVLFNTANVAVIPSCADSPKILPAYLA